MMSFSWLRGSMRWKLVLAAALVEGVMLIMLFANTTRLFNAAIEQQGAQKISDLVPVLNVALAPTMFMRDYSGARRIIDELLRDSSGSLEYLVILDERGRVFSKGGRVDVDALPPAAANPNSNEVLFHGALPLRIDAVQVGELRYGLSLASLFNARASLLQQGMIISLLGMVATLFGLSAVAYWLTRHVKKLMQASQAIAAGRYEIRAEIDSSDEIGQLARYFNDMGTAISAHVQALQVKDAAIASSLNAIAIASLENRLTYVNQAFLRLLRLQGTEDAIGRFPHEFAENPEDVQEIIKALRHRGCWQGELRVRLNDGSLADFEMSASMVKDAAGKPLCMMASFMDVTARKQAERAILAARNQLEATIDAIPDLLFELGLDGTYYDIHAQRQDFLAAPMPELLGRKVSDVMTPESRVSSCCHAILPSATTHRQPSSSSTKNWSSGWSSALPSWLMRRMKRCVPIMPSLIFSRA
jgi:PAS domain S-box-containing protein